MWGFIYQNTVFSLKKQQLVGYVFPEMGAFTAPFLTQMAFFAFYGEYLR